MSNIKFSQLPNLGTITANTIVPVVAANTNYTVTAANLQSYVNSSTGNITGNYFIGNGSQLTGIAASYGNANVVANLAALGSNPVSTTGNVTAGYVIGNGSALTNITGANVSGTVANATYAVSAGSATTAGTVTTAAQPNITSVGILSSASVSGNVTGGNLSIVGGTLAFANANIVQTNPLDLAITGAYQISIKPASGSYQWTFGNDGALTGPTGVGVTGYLSATGNTTGGNIRTAGVVSATGNVTSGGLTVNGSGTVTGNLQVQGTLTYNNLTNITTSNLVFGLANTTTGVSANGAGFVAGNTNEASFLYNYSAQAWNSNIGVSAVGNVAGGNIRTTGVISATGNITGGNLSATSIAGTLSTAAQTNITSVGTLSSLNASGNVTGGNVLTAGVVSATGNVTGNYVLGNGALLTGVITSVANINSGTSNVTVTSSGGNISVGVGGTANVAVFATTGEYVTGVVSASGNITGGNLSGTSIAGTLTTAAQTNITSVGTLGALTVTANVTGGNVLTAGIMSSTGNATHGNILTAGLVSATANVTGGNITTAGLISATGNITGGNISATNHTGTTVSVTGNITAGNVINTGISSVTGNITAGNVLTGGLISATGNISANNANITNYLYVGSTVSNLFKNVPLTVTGANAGNTITGINIVNTGGGGGSGSGIDFYTYVGAGYPPEASIYSVDNADYSANINFATKIPGAGANILATRMTVASNGNVVIPGNLNVGNVIINGQSTSYGVVTPAYMVVGLANSVGSFGLNQTIILDTVVGNVNSQTSYNASTGVFTLTAGVTYDMSFTPSLISFTNLTGGFLCYDWVDATTNALLDTTGIGTGTSIPVTETSGQIDNTTARVIYTPTTNQTVKLRVTNANGTATLRGAIGTQAVIKPLNPTIAVQATATGTINNQYASITNSTDISITNGVAKDVTFDTVTASSGIPYSTSTGVFTLTSGVTYRFTGEISFAGYTGYALFTLVDATTNTAINGQIATCPSYNSGFAEANNNTYDAIYTPSTNQTVKFRVTGSSFTGTGVIRGGYFGRINVQQINNAFALNALATMSLTGNITTSGNVSAAGNVYGTNLTDKTSSSWTVTTGTNTYSITVPINGNYQIWVRANIPNGIIAYQATVSVTNTNVPVLGTQRAWNYTGGGSPILLTTMPTQIVGAEGTISTAVVATTTANRFDFVINNTSGSSQTVYWGYVTL